MKLRYHRRSDAIRVLFYLAIILVLNYSIAYSETLIDNETCLSCHDDMGTSLEYTPHQLSSELDSSGTLITCVQCHDGGEVHVDDPSKENIINPAKQDSFDKRTECFQCHVAHISLDNYGWDVHADQAIDCSNCHRIHSTDDGLLLDDDARFCYACHKDTHNDLMGQSIHPVTEGNVTCLDCHKFVTRSDQNVVLDLQRTCRSCHPQQAGPYAFEHAPVAGYSVSGEGCLECHQAHSSENVFLLNQPENLLCRQCHFPVGHTTAHTGAYADLHCESCHTDIHGSFVSNLFLDANLPSQFGINCYNTGCHSLIR